MATADPGVGSWTPINMFAMLRALINNNCPLLTNAGTPVNGASGTFAGQAGPGAGLIDYVNAVSYINVGTLASPVWAAESSPVSAGIAGGAAGGGLGVLGNAKMTYSFAVDGGAISTITPTNSPTVPQGAIILGGVLDITTTFTAGAGATVALGFGSGAQVAALKAATGFATYTAGLTIPIIPVFTAATYYKLTAAAKMSLTIAVNTLTAGVMDVNLAYVQGNF